MTTCTCTRDTKGNSAACRRRETVFSWDELNLPTNVPTAFPPAEVDMIMSMPPGFDDWTSVLPSLKTPATSAAPSSTTAPEVLTGASGSGTLKDRPPLGVIKFRGPQVFFSLLIFTFIFLSSSYLVWRVKISRSRRQFESFLRKISIDSQGTTAAKTSDFTIHSKTSRSTAKKTSKTDGDATSADNSYDIVSSFDRLCRYFMQLYESATASGTVMKRIEFSLSRLSTSDRLSKSELSIIGSPRRSFRTHCNVQKIHLPADYGDPKLHKSTYITTRADVKLNRVLAYSLNLPPPCKVTSVYAATDPIELVGEVSQCGTSYLSLPSLLSLCKLKPIELKFVTELERKHFKAKPDSNCRRRQKILDEDLTKVESTGNEGQLFAPPSGDISTVESGCALEKVGETGLASAQVETDLHTDVHCVLREVIDEMEDDDNLCLNLSSHRPLHTSVSLEDEIVFFESPATPMGPPPGFEDWHRPLATAVGSHSIEH